MVALSQALLDGGVTILEFTLTNPDAPHAIARVKDALGDRAAVKVFPAGGLVSRYIKNVLALLPHLKLIPTGGIDANNIAEFINAGAFATGIGSALCNKIVITNKDWKSLSESSQELREAIP